MRDNQLQVNSSGVWMKTSEDNVAFWRISLEDTLKLYGYTLVHSAPLDDCHHMAFEKGDESLFVNCFNNGHIQISTNEIDRMIDSIVPHLEVKVAVTFERDDDDKYTYIPYVPDYLTKPIKHREIIEPLGYTVRKKSVEAEREEVKKIIDDYSTTRLHDRSSFHAGVMKGSYVKLQDDLVKTRKRLTSTEDELKDITKEISRLTTDLTSYTETAKRDNYRKYYFETFSPLYDYKFGSYGYRRYLDDKVKGDTISSTTK